MKAFWIILTLLLWIPTVLVWCFWAPLFYFMVKAGTKVSERNITMRWKWFGVYARLANHKDYYDVE